MSAKEKGNPDMKRWKMSVAAGFIASALLISGYGPHEAPDKEEKSVVISLAGDCSLGNLSIHGYAGTFREMYDSQGPGYFFKNVKPIFEADDMTLVNFEGVLTNSDNRVPKAFNIKGKPEYIQILPEADIEAVSFGNNHRIDYGAQGIADTIAAFASIGLPYACNETVGMYETEDGVKVGFVSVSVVDNGRGVEPWLQSGITQLRESEADVILACCHWGQESVYYPDDYQKELGRKCIDWGADLVVGCHPHVLQGVEAYQGKYILYSLGNFCFGANRNPSDKDTMIAQVKFTLDEKNIVGTDLTLIPCTISSVMHRNDYCPTPAEGEKKADMIRKLNAYSAGMGVVIGEDGRVNVPMEETAAKEDDEEEATESADDAGTELVTSPVITVGEK